MSIYHYKYAYFETMKINNKEDFDYIYSILNVQRTIMETNYKINKNAITKSILKVQEDKINTNILKTK